MSKLTIVYGDITQFEGDVIVNAANSSLLGGGGVDGAIHRAAGKKLLQECAALGGCVTGEAKLTKGYDLPAKYIIHTVGPVYSAYAKEDAKKLLISCYNKSLSLAFLNNLRKIAFPLISAGVYGYPKKEALEVAIETITQFNQDLDVTLILFDKEAYSIVCNNFSEFCI